MRTNKERQQLIHKRTQEIKIEERKKRQYMISGISIAACLIAVVGLGMYLPSVMKQNAAGKMNYSPGMASMLGQYDALGYICMGILAFALGVCVTVLLYRMKRAEEHRQEKKQYERVRNRRKRMKSRSRSIYYFLVPAKRPDLYYSGAGTWLFYDGDFVLCVIPLHSR